MLKQHRSNEKQREAKSELLTSVLHLHLPFFHHVSIVHCPFP